MGSASPRSRFARVSRRTIAYQPALDGVRALAVAAVLLFHGGISWMTGGYLGVSVFFTLSGFLITSLLVQEHATTGRVSARAFYTRRARRLLPASLACLLGVCVIAWSGGFKGVPNLRRDVLGALFQVYNWVKLFAGDSYADLLAQGAGVKNPLDHYWSLAIEEQFYWIWPVAFIGVVALSRRLRWSLLTVMAVLFGVAAVAAPVIAAVWGSDAAYFATPARISEILAGALLAVWVRGRALPGGVRHAAPLALVALTVACVVFPAGEGPAYEGALPLIAVGSALLILGLQVDGPLRKVLSLSPFVGLGRISYGVYLFHWPIYVLIDREHWDLPVGALLSIKVAITLAVALLSYFLLERPVRTSEWLVPRRTLVGALAGSAVVIVATLAVPTVTKFYEVDPALAEEAAIDTGTVEPLTPLTTSTTTVATAPGTDVVVTTTTIAATTTTVELVPPRPVRIVVAGDSTAEALGNGLVQWAAANPNMAQVEIVAGAGCGLSLGGYLVFHDSERDIDSECGPYVEGVLPDRVAELHPDVVVLMTTTWDVADRRVEAGGPVLSSADPAAEAQIQESFQRLTDRLLGLGVSRVVWIHEAIPIVGMISPLDRQGDAARHESLWGIMDELAAANPAVRVADLATWTNTNGIGDDVPSRPDAIHWTPEAALLIADEYLGPLLVREALT